MSPPANVRGLLQWVRLLLGLVLIFSALQWSALTLGSDRGQAGVLVGLLVVAATLVVERFLFGQRAFAAVRTLGLGAPGARGLAAVGGIGVLLFVVVAVFVRASGARVSFYPGWISLLPGLFAQAGIAEEILFRGYLFGHLRRGRSFWGAATISMLPFVSVHLFLFLTMPWPIAAAAMLLAVVLSFPFAHLFELGNATIWAPAALHFIIQGTLKVLVFSGDGSSALPLVWMVASGVLPLLSFLIARPSPVARSSSEFGTRGHATAATRR